MVPGERKKPRKRRAAWGESPITNAREAHMSDARRAEEAKEEKIMLEKINNSRRILTESLQKYADSSMTSDDLLQDLIKVLDKYGIRDSTRLREALECLYILLTV